MALPTVDSLAFLDDFFTQAARMRLKKHIPALQQAMAQHYLPREHGDLQRWLDALARLPDVQAASHDFTQDLVRVGDAAQLDAKARAQMDAALMALHTWRKGPFNFFGTEIDCEWRSDWKWQRVMPHIKSLAGKVVLDVGCGSGYHGWRMLGEGARMVVGAEPMLLYLCQYWAVKRYVPDAPFYLLPLKCEHLPLPMPVFDTVFSMGVIYHRRSPFDHLEELRDLLVRGGELVLETLVIDGDENTVLVPRGRYSKMGNVFFIPSPAALQVWVERSGFKNVRIVDVNETSTDEQRKTPWMTFDSLAEFLDPNDPSKTVEGYPRPKRAILVAERK